MVVDPRKESPYVGPRPFELSERKIFWGRRRETRQIVDRIFANRILLLYAPSGAGKTSLLNAGIIPQLKEEGFDVLPLARVKGPIPEGINFEEIRNFYAFNCIRHYVGDQADLRRLTQKTLAEYLKEREHALDELKQPLLRALILDQLEELLSGSPEYWQHRKAFFQQVHEALEQDYLLRVVLVLREDSVGSMESYASLLPDEPHTRFRLERMSKQDALAAVVEPLKETGRSFAQGVAESLVERLLRIQVETAAGTTKYVIGEFIEPVQLQVVCKALWGMWPPGKKVITIEDIEAFANIDEALLEFYDNVLRRVVRATGVNESQIREWFEHTLITPNGVRALVLQGQDETGGLSNVVVDELVNVHLVRAEIRRGARYCELTHDRFIQPILKSNQRVRGRDTF
jgi:hypothetical protein